MKYLMTILVALIATSTVYAGDLSKKELERIQKEVLKNPIVKTAIKQAKDFAGDNVCKIEILPESKIEKSSELQNDFQLRVTCSSGTTGEGSAQSYILIRGNKFFLPAIDLQIRFAG